MIPATFSTLDNGGSDRPTGARHHPDRPRRLPVQGRRGPGHLRGQGQGAAEPPVELLRPPGVTAGAHAADGRRRRERRVDRGQERGRGVLPRVQPHQAAPAPVQHPPQGRQVVPVPRRHARRGMAAGDGDAGRQAEGRPLLRAVRARVRHPGDARPAAADVPDPHVHAGEVRSPSPPRAPVPLRAHREVRGAVRRGRRARRLRPTGRRPARVPRRRSLARPRPARQADAQRRRLARVRASRSLARPDHVGAQGHRASADGRAEGGGLRLHRARRGSPRGVGAGVLRAEGPGRRP